MSGHINKKEIDEIWSTLNNSKQEIEEGYFGKTLVYESERYTPGHIVYQKQNSSGSFSVLDNGYYKITIVGGGGGRGYGDAVYWQYYACAGGGGSGSAVQIVCRLKKKTNYSYVAGGPGGGGKGQAGSGGNSSFANFTAYGGTGGYGKGDGHYHGGTGGSYPSVSIPVPEYVTDTLFAKSGNNGSGQNISTSASGGASVYNGWGAGGSNGNGGTGVVEVVYLGKRYSPSLKTLTININVPATVKINGEIVAEDVTTYSTSMYYNKSITWEVSADGYVSQSDTYVYTSLSNTATINVELLNGEGG